MEQSGSNHDTETLDVDWPIIKQIYDAKFMRLVSRYYAANISISQANGVTSNPAFIWTRRGNPSILLI